MPINAETETKFEKIAQLIAVEVSCKLSSILNKNVSVSYSRIIDPAMSGNQIVVKRDSYLLSVPIVNPDRGPLSLIVNAKQVCVIADLVMGGDGHISDDTKPDEVNQTVFAETIKQVIVSSISRLNKLKGETVFNSGEHEFRFLQSIKESSLKKPAGVEDSIACGFKIKIQAKLDDPIHLELNTSALEELVSSFAVIVDEIDLEKLEKEIREEYSGGPILEEEEKAITVIEEELSDAQKIDEKRNLKFLTDINLDLIVELGRAEMMMKDILKLTKGSAIELEKACNEPVDLYVHNQLVAKGEVVAIDDCFGLKITELSGNLNLAKQMGLKLSKTVR